MDQDRSAPRSAADGSEDTTRAEEHVRHAAENRDALEAQAQRTEATAAGETDRPVAGIDTQPDRLGASGREGGVDTAPRASDPHLSGGMRAEGAGSEDTSEAEANVREAERNRDALEAQSRRVDATTPPDASPG